MNKSGHEVTVYYLEMQARQDLRPSRTIDGLSVVECEIKQFEFNRFLYQWVGAQWSWSDRLVWSEQQWKTVVESDAVKTWVAYFKGSPAGFFELQSEADSGVEILYFGLAPGFVGHGFGGDLLTRAITQAWRLKNTKRVWVHTCTLDHPAALNNYQARGLRIYHTEVD